jgi:hypothetical protein
MTIIPPRISLPLSYHGDTEKFAPFHRSCLSPQLNTNPTEARPTEPSLSSFSVFFIDGGGVLLQPRPWRRPHGQASDSCDGVAALLLLRRSLLPDFAAASSRTPPQSSPKHASRHRRTTWRRVAGSSRRRASVPRTRRRRGPPRAACPRVGAAASRHVLQGEGADMGA